MNSEASRMKRALKMADRKVLGRSKKVLTAREALRLAQVRLDEAITERRELIQKARKRRFFVSTP